MCPLSDLITFLFYFIFHCKDGGGYVNSYYLLLPPSPRSQNHTHPTLAHNYRTVTFKAKYTLTCHPIAVRFHMAGASPADSDSPDFSVVSWTSEKPCEPRRTSGEGDTSDDTSSPFPSEARSSSRDHQTAPRNKNRLSVSSSAAGSGAVSDGNRAYPTNSLPEQSLAYLPSSHPPTAFSTGSSIESYAQSIPSTQLPGLSANSPLSPSGVYPTFPLQDVQEACLLHYFVQEISKWVSLILSVALHNFDIFE